MARYLKIADNSGGCCSCENQSGCECSGVPCQRECRSKAGVAALCGFEEFVDPTVPPRRFRRRNYSGTMAVEEFPGKLDCEESECGSSAAIGWTGTIAESPFTYSATLSLILNYISGGVANYTLSGVSGDDNDGGTESPLNNLHVRGAYVIPGFPTGYVAPGGSVSFNVPVGVEFYVSVEFNYVYWHGGPQQCVLAGRRLIEDSWDLVQQYDQDTCELSEVDNSSREQNGEPVELPCERPSLCYNGVAMEEDQTLRRITGDGCVTSGGTSSEATGNVLEALTEEDTEDDAIERAAAGIEWSPPADCKDHTAFITPRGAGEFAFGFRIAEFRIRSGTVAKPLIVGHVYLAEVRVMRRTLASGGPFLDYTTMFLEFLATQPIEVSDWFQIPNESGYETKAAACQIQDLSAL